MIIHHHDNVAAFSGNHTFYLQFQPIIQSRISATSAGPSVVLLAQSRGLMRLIQSRVFGRVN